jgi:hypothetical protein
VVGDILRDLNELEEGEKEYTRVLELTKKIFGENHPAIITPNGNLITLLTSGDNLEKNKERVKDLIDSNYKIAESAYGTKSIHMVYHLSGNIINLIGLGEVSTPSQANPTIKVMRQIITDYHGGNPRGVNNQLFFQI